jgi:hypothetical protein
MGTALSTQCQDAPFWTAIIGIVLLAAPLSSMQLFKYYTSGDSDYQARQLKLVGASGDSVSEHSQFTANSAPNLHNDVEYTAHRLMKRAKASSNHHEQVKIAETLFKLGKVLLKNNDYKGARHVLHQAEALQHHVVRHSIRAVAAAMEEQSQYYYKKNGMKKMAERYHRTAADLRERPTPCKLSVTWMVHNKCEETSDAELEKIMDKVEGRLKRASHGAIPLSKMLKEECAALRLEVEDQPGGLK